MLIPDFDRLGQEAQGVRCPSWVKPGPWALSAALPLGLNSGIRRVVAPCLSLATSRIVPATSIGSCAAHSPGLRLLRLPEILAGKRMPRV